MKVGALEKILVDTQLGSVGPNIGKRGLGRFLHYIAELTRELEVSLALHPGRFDEDDLATHLSPDQPGRHASDLRSLRHLGAEPSWSEVFVELFDVDRNRIILVGDQLFGDLHCNASDNAGDVALEVSNARLVGVDVNDLLDDRIG